MNWEVNELYSKENRKYYASNPKVTSIKINSIFTEIKMIGIYIQSLYLSLFFLFKKNTKNSIFICNDIRLLLFFPKKTLNDLNIIVMQHCKLELIYGKIAKKILSRRYKYLDFVVYTDIDKKKLTQMFTYINHQKIHAIPLGCNLTVKSNKLVNKSDLFNLVTIARISEEKNLSEMILLFNNLPSNYFLHIYGDGLSDKVNKLKNEINSNKNITFHGPTKNVSESLNDKSIFLMTSIYEGFGQTLIEARSQGLPIVAYETFDTLQTIVEDGYNGYRIKPYDRDEFVSAIIKISENLELYQQMSNNAIIKAQETENNKINEKWNMLFNSLIKDTGI